MPNERSQAFDLSIVSGGHSRPVAFRLDDRGLEWRDPAGHDRWMPYACMRRIAIGRQVGKFSLLRLSGPPGSVLIGEGSPGHVGTLVKAILDQALAGRVRAVLRVNNAPCRVAWLWARTGRRASFAELSAEEFSTD